MSCDLPDDVFASLNYLDPEPCILPAVACNATSAAAQCNEDVAMIAEHDSPEMSMNPVTNSVQESAPFSKAPKKRSLAAVKKDKVRKVRPRSTIFTKENIHLLVENTSRAPETTATNVQSSSLTDKSKVARKATNTPLQPLRLDENHAAPFLTPLQIPTGPVAPQPQQPFYLIPCVLPHSSGAQPSTSAVNDTELYSEVLERPRKHTPKTKHTSETAPVTFSAMNPTIRQTREALDREIDQLADGKKRTVEPIIIRTTHAIHPLLPSVTVSTNSTGIELSDTINLPTTSHADVSNPVNVVTELKRLLKRPLTTKHKVCKNPRVHTDVSAAVSNTGSAASVPASSMDSEVSVPVSSANSEVSVPVNSTDSEVSLPVSGADSVSAVATAQMYDAIGCDVSLPVSSADSVSAIATAQMYDAIGWAPAEAAVFKEQLDRYLRYKIWLPKIVFFCNTFERLLSEVVTTDACKAELYALRRMQVDTEIPDGANPL